MAETVQNQIILTDVLLQRLSLTKPFVGRDAPINPATGQPEGKYHADLILGPDHPQLAAFQTLMREAVARKFKDDAAVVLEQIRANNKFPLHRGDVDRAGKPEYAGKLFISANNDEQPTIVVTENGVNIANRGTPVVLTPSHPCYPYPGCHANVHLAVYAYSHPKGGKGVACQLMGVQFLRHGPRLSGASVSSVTEFPLVATAADATLAPQAATGGGGGLI